MDVVKDDMMLVGGGERMQGIELDDWLWSPLRGTVKRKGRRRRSLGRKTTWSGCKIE